MRSRICASRGLIYEGRLPPPKGAPVDDYEDREQTLFKATAFGDDVDRPLMKSDGSFTYFASDIAYHRDKHQRGFNTMIDVWGADHGGYIKRMRAAVQAVTAGKGTLDVEICQLVRLLRNGQEVKMSKRSGTFVTLREVVDEVGARRRPLHDAEPQERRDARFRSGQGGRADEGQSRLSTCSTPTPGRVGVPAGAGGLRRGGLRPGRSRRSRPVTLVGRGGGAR